MNKLKKSEYTISSSTLNMVLEALGDNWFISLGDGEEDNNDDIIDAQKALELEIDKQNKD